MEPTFSEQLRSLINRNSRENASNTPDFILAKYIEGCLAAFESAIVQREIWYGRLVIGSTVTLSEEATHDQS